MKDKNRKQLPQHKTSVNQTPENQLTRYLELNVSNARAIARVAAYERNQLRDTAAIATRVAAYERNQLRDTAVIATRVAAYERNQLRDIAAIATRVAAYERNQLRDIAAIATRVAAYERNQLRDVAATVKRAVEAHQYQQKQASIEFPNIIRSGLSANLFRISTPTQRRTPLLESPPTINTGEVYEEISPEIIPAPSPELVPTIVWTIYIGWTLCFSTFFIFLRVLNVGNISAKKHT